MVNKALLAAMVLGSAATFGCMGPYGACGQCRPQSMACRTGCEPCGDACGAAPCAGPCGCEYRDGHCGPLTVLFNVFRCRTWCGGCGCGGCDGGCGERYWGEWISNPPTCDNCDFGQCRSCGHITGPAQYETPAAPVGRPVCAECQARAAAPQGYQMSRSASPYTSGSASQATRVVPQQRTARQPATVR